VQFDVNLGVVGEVEHHVDAKMTPCVGDSTITSARIVNHTAWVLAAGL
jgi:hypothetical protein